jgi:hypothetical protein
VRFLIPGLALWLFASAGHAEGERLYRDVQRQLTATLNREIAARVPDPLAVAWGLPDIPTLPAATAPPASLAESSES